MYSLLPLKYLEREGIKDAHDKLTYKQLNSTSLDLKSSFIESMKNSIDRAIDLKIINIIDKACPAVTNLGANNAAISGGSGGNTYVYQATALTTPVPTIKVAANLDAAVQALFEHCAYAFTLAKETTVSKRQGVALAMTLSMYSKLFRATRLTSSDYRDFNGFNNKKSIFGCDVVIINGPAWGRDGGYKTPRLTATNLNVDGGGVVSATGGTASTFPAAPNETIFIIPSKTIGVCEWENAIAASAWEEKAQDCMFFMAKKSFGCVAIEPESLTKVVLEGAILSL